MDLKDEIEDCPQPVLDFSKLEDEFLYLQTPTTINIILNSILTLTATLGNGMIIVTILRSQNLQTPSYLLITSLAFSDFLVGLVYHPLQIVLCMFYLKNNIQGLCGVLTEFLFVITFLGSLSFFMVTCISIDRYLAITLRHRYNVIVTKKRVRLLIVLVWIVSIPLPFLTRWEHLVKQLQIIGSVLSLILLSITCVFYIKSFRALHVYTAQVHAQQPTPLAGNFDVVRYKKTLKTMLVVLACLLLCYVPVLGALIFSSFVGLQRDSLLLFFTSLTSMGLNSSVNPVLYLIRFADIRNACKQQLKNVKLCN